MLRIVFVQLLVLLPLVHLAPLSDNEVQLRLVGLTEADPSLLRAALLTGLPDNLRIALTDADPKLLKVALTMSKPILLSTALNGSVESLVPDTGMNSKQLLKFVLTQADAATVESALTTLNDITVEEGDYTKMRETLDKMDEQILQSILVNTENMIVEGSDSSDEDPVELDFLHDSSENVVFLDEDEYVDVIKNNSLNSDTNGEAEQTESIDADIGTDAEHAESLNTETNADPEDSESEVNSLNSSFKEDDAEIINIKVDTKDGFIIGKTADYDQHAGDIPLTKLGELPIWNGVDVIESARSLKNLKNKVIAVAIDKEGHDHMNSAKNIIINVEANKDETSEKFQGINNLKKQIDAHLGMNEVENPPKIEDEAVASIIEMDDETTVGTNEKEDEVEITEETFEVNLGINEKGELKIKDEIDYEDEITSESSKVTLKEHLEELEKFIESVDNKSAEDFEDLMESINNLEVESEKTKDKMKNEASSINNEYRKNLKEIENKIEAILKAL